MNEQQGPPSGQTSYISPLDGTLAKKFAWRDGWCRTNNVRGTSDFREGGHSPPFQFQGKQKSASGDVSTMFHHGDLCVPMPYLQAHISRCGIESEDV